MRSTAQRDTQGELVLRGELTRLRLRYRVNVKLPGTRRTADIAFIRLKVAVFVDGCFWHGCPVHGTWPKANAEWWRTKIEANRQRDNDTNHRLQLGGWLVLRFWEHVDPSVAATCVLKALAARQQGV